eukprot:5817900-Amphidinium_carterae.1
MFGLVVPGHEGAPKAVLVHQNRPPLNKLQAVHAPSKKVVRNPLSVEHVSSSLSAVEACSSSDCPEKNSSSSVFNSRSSAANRMTQSSGKRPAAQLTSAQTPLRPRFSTSCHSGLACADQAGCSWRSLPSAVVAHPNPFLLNMT